MADKTINLLYPNGEAERSKAEAEEEGPVQRRRLGRRKQKRLRIRGTTREKEHWNMKLVKSHATAINPPNNLTVNNLPESNFSIYSRVCW